MRFFDEHPKIARIWNAFVFTFGICGLWASGFIFAYHGFTDTIMTQRQALSWLLITLGSIAMVVSCPLISSQVQIDKVEIITKSMSVDGNKEECKDDIQIQQEE